MDDTIKLSIKKALPFIEDGTLDALLEHLEYLGVNNFDDLKLIEEKDLTDVVKTIQARILIKCWKTTGMLCIL